VIILSRGLVSIGLLLIFIAVHWKARESVVASWHFKLMVSGNVAVDRFGVFFFVRSRLL